MSIVSHLSRVFFTSILLLAASNPSQASDGSEILVYADSYPPQLLLDADIPATGPTAERIRQYLDFSDVPGDLRYSPWTRLLVRLEEGEIEFAAPMTRTPEREDQYHWILPLFRSEFHLTSLARKNIGPELTKADIRAGRYKATCGKKTVHCLILREMGFPEDCIIEITGEVLKSSLHMLEQERVQFIVGDVASHSEVARLHGLQNEKLVIHTDFSVSRTDYLVASKQIAEDLLVQLKTSAKEFVANTGIPLLQD